MEDHWCWRRRMAERIASEIDPETSGAVAVYLIGSVRNACAGPASDIDLLIHFRGSEEQERELRSRLEEWSRRLADWNCERTGHECAGLLDLHLVTDTDIERRTSYAVKIGAVTDSAAPLPMKRAVRRG